MMSVGAVGVISVASHLVPAELVQMVKLADAGDYAAARKIHQKYYPIFRDLFVESNPIPVKAAMAELGKCALEYRLPLCELSAPAREKLLKTMKACGIL